MPWFDVAIRPLKLLNAPYVVLALGSTQLGRCSTSSFQVLLALAMLLLVTFLPNAGASLGSEALLLLLLP